jgi:hypothetical protein
MQRIAASVSRFSQRWLSARTPVVRSADDVYAKPLGKEEIRVLALRRGDGDALLEGRIHLASATAARGDLASSSSSSSFSSYEAISYVWGSQDTPEVIRCSLEGYDGQVDLPLTRSAADALRAVRLVDGERRVWIDAICVSQTAGREKAAQVAVMDRIFANATAVLIWLGADEGVRSVAVANVAGRILECFGDDADTRFRGTARLDDTAAVKVMDPVVRQSCYDEVGAVLPLFECEWFWRLWCVQELALARQPLLYWGSVVLTWEAVLATAAFVEARAQLDVAHTGYAGVHNVIMLECLREQVRDRGIRRMPFSRLLSLTRLHGVTDPCDRIFSLLGLDRRLSISWEDLFRERYPDSRRVGGHCRHFGSRKVSAIQPLVNPDYSQGIDRLYLSAAKALLLREGNLHLLSFVQHGAQVGEGKLPSWVPQWHINEHRLITQFDLLPDDPTYASLATALAESTMDVKSAVCTAGKLSRSDFFVSDDGTLHTQGLSLDTVAKSCSGAKFTADSSHKWLETLREWYQSASAWFAQGVQPSLVNTTPDQHEDVLFRMFYQTILGGHFRARDVFLGLGKELDAFRSALRLGGGPDDVDLCPTTRAFVTQICRSRTLFLTDGGRLGIGPQCLQPGDCVCFLKGAAVPLLLRPRSGPDVARRRWFLVGETYVNNLAGATFNGEAAEDTEALPVPEDDESMTQNLLPTPKHQSFLDVLGPARRDRSFAMMSNARMDPDEWGQVYFSDLGKIEVRRPAPMRHPRGNFIYASGRPAARETSRATIVGSCERIQFCIS